MWYGRVQLLRAFHNAKASPILRNTGESEPISSKHGREPACDLRSEMIHRNQSGRLEKGQKVKDVGETSIAMLGSILASQPPKPRTRRHPHCALASPLVRVPILGLTIGPLARHQEPLKFLALTLSRCLALDIRPTAKFNKPNTATTTSR
eukprot:g37553.t1